MSDTAPGSVQRKCNMTGTFFHALDTKGRINFPAKLREMLGETFWLSKGSSGKFLAVHSQAGWDDLMQQIEDKKGPGAEKLRRWLCAGAVEVTPDKQGRILIPPPLRMYAGLETGEGVVVAGAGLKAEIWSETHWMQFNSDFEEEASLILEELCM